MTGTEIFGLVTGAYDVVKSIGMGIINLFTMDKVDQTKLAELKHQQILAQQNFEFTLRQAEIWMAEKMMVGQRWTVQMALITGSAIVFMCLLNMICVTFGWSLEVTFWTPSFLILVGVFMFSASGSTRLLVAVTEFLVDQMEKNKSNTVSKSSVKNITKP